MKRHINRFIAFWLLCATAFSASAQNITGIWRGYFITEMGEQYKLEFQLKLNPSRSLTGVSYSYLDTRFYGKATMNGRFSSGQTFSIQELRTVEVRNMGGAGTCLMNYQFSYVRSGREEFLEGTYVGKREDRANPKNNGTWGDCGGGRVFLRRVTASDFYTEPFLKTPAPPAETPPAARPAPAQPRNPPKAANSKPQPPVTATPKKPAPTRNTGIARDSQQTIAAPAVVARPAQRPRFAPPAATRDRKNELTQTFTVTSKEVVIKLYDNGEVDNDTISVYLDGQLILSNKRLSAAPITYTLTMGEEETEHTLIMVAENLGRIPPNTSLMIVQDGDRRFQTSITSTEQKNAMVRFRFQKPG